MNTCDILTRLIYGLLFFLFDSNTSPELGRELHQEAISAVRAKSL